MGTLLVYILKSAICLAWFYLFYRLLLSRETFHRFNRFALLGLLFLSAILPMVEVTVEQAVEVQQVLISLEEWFLMAQLYGNAQPESIQTQAINFTWSQLLLLLYILGLGVFILRHLYSLLHLTLLLKSGKSETLSGSDSKILADGVRLLVHNKQVPPFSWMRYVVVSRRDLEENGREILTHELAHIHNRHSWDLLLADVCVLFQWFNPAAWLLKQELQAIHEYEADETVLKMGVDAKQYQMLLIKKAVGKRLYSMANNLNHSNLKKRITMMMKKKSNPWARLKYLYVLPVAAIAVSAFARPEVVETSKEISNAKVNDLVAIVETKATENAKLPQDTLKNRPVFRVVEEIPQFPGGASALMKFIADNVRYPLEAQKQKQQGRVVVQFIVEEDGKLTNAKVVSSVSPLLDAEALRVVSMMPQWTPGNQRGQAVACYFTIPVVFRLTGQAAKDAEKSNGAVTVVGFQGN
ncbi:MAG: M56 family metallopeptidase [Mediterranea massiliensis]|nr:M56 family metallopeptidase [Mediterranea massiliensis]